MLCLTNRYYDPTTARFLTRDPIGYEGGINLYGFCAGNPINNTDPFGTQDDSMRSLRPGMQRGTSQSRRANRMLAPIKTTAYLAAEIHPWSAPIEAIAGKEAATGRKLSTGERSWAAFQSGLPLLGMLGRSGKVVKLFRTTLDVTVDAVEAAPGPARITVIGMMEDVKNFHGPGYDHWGYSGVGSTPSLIENKAWLYARVKRGDRFILATDPAKLRRAIETGTGGRWTSHEMKWLRESGTKLWRGF